MAKDPAFLFYPNDFTSGTQFFTDEQVGKYIRVLMAQHQHGHLTEKQVIFITKSYDNDVFAKLTKDESGLYYNKRLEEEVIKRKNYTESRGKNKLGKTKLETISKSCDFDMENENINKDISNNEIGIEGKKSKTKKYSLDEYVKENKTTLGEIFSACPTIKKTAFQWLEYKFKKKGYKETKWATQMVERIKKTSVEFIEQRIIDTIAGETYEDYFYANHQVEFDKSTGKPLGVSTQAKKPKEKTLEELRNS